jgi:hypothetical protein
MADMIGVLLNPKYRHKLACIVAYRGVTISALVRNWIDAAYNRLPEEAK